MTSSEGMVEIVDRKRYPNAWHTDLMDTISADFSYFCFALWCSPCASYLQRKQALRNDMSRYQCCAGYQPCSGNCCEEAYPGFCLCTEVLCCLGSSVQSTRFLLQDELNIRNTKCDDCIMGYNWFTQCVGRFCLATTYFYYGSNLMAPAEKPPLPGVIDVAYCGVCPCMLTQQKIELDKRDRKLAMGSMKVPFPQQMSRMSRTVPPPAAGYPPRGAANI